MWTDVSSYSHGERGKKEPNAWETRVGKFRLTVVRNHINRPGQWTVSLHPAFSDCSLGISDENPVEHAQELAVHWALTILGIAVSALNELVPDKKGASPRWARILSASAANRRARVSTGCSKLGGSGVSQA